MNEARKEESIKSGSNIPAVHNSPKQAFPSINSLNNTTKPTKHIRDITREGGELPKQENSDYSEIIVKERIPGTRGDQQLRQDHPTSRHQAIHETASTFSSLLIPVLSLVLLVTLVVALGSVRVIYSHHVGTKPQHYRAGFKAAQIGRRRSGFSEEEKLNEEEFRSKKKTKIPLCAESDDTDDESINNDIHSEEDIEKTTNKNPFEVEEQTFNKYSGNLRGKTKGREHIFLKNPFDT